MPKTSDVPLKRKPQLNRAGPRFGYRKLRKYGVLDNLNSKVHGQLAIWLTTAHVSYVAVCKKLKKIHNVDAKPADLAIFYKKYVYPEVVYRRHRAVQTAFDLRDEIQNNPADFFHPAIDALAQRAMTLTLDPNSKPKDLKLFMDLLLRFRSQGITEQKVKLLIRQVKMLEKKERAARAALKDGNLSDTEKAERMRHILNGKEISNGEVKQTRLLTGFTS